METGLSGKVVLVTGGAGGIGQSICKAFSYEGARIVVHYHESEESARELAKELGGVAMGADLRDPEEASRLISDVISELGSLDICIANAGSYPPISKPLWEIDPVRWSETMASNLGVTVNTARSFLSHASKAKAGSMVMVGSTAGIYGESGHSDYAAAKGAITSGLMMSLKNDVSELAGVRVNAVAPGWTVTQKKLDQGIDDEMVERAIATMSLKKLATPEDVARVVVILSSDSISGHVTGQVIEVAGGMEGRLIP